MIITPDIKLLTAPPDLITPDFASFEIITLFPSIHPTRIPKFVGKLNFENMMGKDNDAITWAIDFRKRAVRNNIS